MLQKSSRLFLIYLVLLAAAQTWADAAPAEERMALVIGNVSYDARALTTAANDAGLVSEALHAASFDVVGARDLGGNSMRRAIGDLVDRASRTGKDTVVVIYFAGYGLQLEGENYLLPVDVRISRDTDVAMQGLRVSDIVRSLAEIHLKASIIILDAARPIPFAIPGDPLASGLAWEETEPSMLLAFNATPGTVAPDERGFYSAYAKALAEMMNESNRSVVDVFKRVRLRVEQATNGAQVPWEFSRVQERVAFVERSPGAQPLAGSFERAVSLRARPMPELTSEDAYLVALLRDTFDGYADFLAAYGQEPIAKRLRAILSVRREAVTWLRTYQANTPEAYWSYLNRYPRGPHAGDSRRRLARLGVSTKPPSKFAPLEYDLPFPLPDESEYLQQPTLMLGDPRFEFVPPPQIMEPPPSELAVLTSQPPAPSDQAHSLPMPIWAQLKPQSASIVFEKGYSTAAATSQGIAPAPKEDEAGSSAPSSGANAAEDAGSRIVPQLLPSTAPGMASIAAQSPLSAPDPGAAVIMPFTLPSPVPSLTTNQLHATLPPSEVAVSAVSAGVPLPIPRPRIPFPSGDDYVPLPSPRPKLPSTIVNRGAPSVLSATATTDRETTPSPPFGLPRSLSPATPPQPPAPAPAKPR